MKQFASILTKILKAVCVAALMTTLVGIASAQNLKGEDDPAFRSAVDDWLAGRDLPALETFASLARDGNRAAQILLANIAGGGHFHSHITGDLPRADRIALLRKPGGLSGKSWLTEAQADEPLAAALLQSGRILEKNAAVATLIRLGEPVYGLAAIEVIQNQADADAIMDAIAALEAPLPDDIHLAILWPHYVGERNAPRQLRYLRQALLKNGIGFPADRLEIAQIAHRVTDLPRLRQSAEFQEEITELGKNVESWAPVRSLCMKNCSDKIDACTVFGAQMLHLSGFFPMRSPLESLIPTREYWTSDRIEADMARLLPDQGNKRRGAFPQDMEACFTDSMVTLQSKHGFAKRD